jgi:hypothetical protein
MSAKPGLGDYLRAAFSARPIGMFVAPNWIGLAAFGMLGLVNPGFWLLGLGLEVGYLTVVATNERFQRTVAGSKLLEARRQWQSRVDQYVVQLGPQGQLRYRALEKRCREILEQQAHLALGPTGGLDVQSEGLGRLLWVYLRLLVTRQAIDRLVQSGGVPDDRDQLSERVANLQTRLKDPSVGDELRRSLTGQIEILQQRVEKRGEARSKLAFLDAELTRIQEQAELIHEQAILSTDSGSVSQRIDQITSSLEGTTQWIKEQQKVFGVVEDLMAEPPVLPAGTPASQSQ